MELYPVSAAQRQSARVHAADYRTEHASELLRCITDGLLKVAWMQTFAGRFAAGRLMNEVVEIESGQAEPVTNDEIARACLHLAAIAWFDQGEHEIPLSFSVMDNPFLYVAESCFWDVAVAPEPEDIRPLVRGGDPEGSPLVVYRHWGENETLLYVGQTSRFWSRQSAHKSRARWWSDVAVITWEPHATREAALLAEKVAIETERPVHNRQRGRA